MGHGVKSSEARAKNFVPPLPEMPKRVLINLTTICNLKCPFCFLHGSEDERARVKHGSMTEDQARQIIDEIAPSRPIVQPNLWSEPLLAKHLAEHIAYMKERGIAVCMNTNGLTLTEKMAQSFVDMKMDTVFFSVDAMTRPTYQKIRGVDQLEKLNNKVELLLKVRGAATYPRIGVTLTQTCDNEAEVADFVAYWTKRVDVVRIGLVTEKGLGFHIEVDEPRIPCPLLYDSMSIQVNGDVSICCQDSLGEYTVGNVFTDGGVKAVWHGEKFNRLRKLHEEGRFDEEPLCAKCNIWAGQVFTEETKDGILIRRSSQYTYYNRVDRMGSWTREETELAQSPASEGAATSAMSPGGVAVQLGSK